MKIKIIYFVCVLLYINLLNAQSTRPFWTEKSTYTEGTKTFFVGVATAKKNVEQARVEALSNARLELMNHLQISDVKDITFHTQMTFEEKTPSGETTTYRLMYVESSDIEKLREKSSRELIKSQELLNKANESRIIKTEEAIRTSKIIEQKLKSKQTELEKIASIIESISSDAMDKLKCGMTKSEVIKVIGNPRSTEKCVDKTTLNYGKVWAIFEGGVLSCLAPVKDYSSCTSCFTYNVQNYKNGNLCD